MSSIPIIDFAGFSSSDADKRSLIAHAVHEAVSGIGFMYVKNLAIDYSAVNAAFQSSERFFASSREQKEECPYKAELNHGYQAVGGQRLDAESTVDLKETFTMRDVSRNAEKAAMWPSKAFSTIANSMFETCLDGANQVMEAFAIALDLPADFFRKCHLGENIALRYLHYPVINDDTSTEQMGAGAHTDFGTVTLLFQDDVGGLEVMGLDGNWHAATYIPDTIVVNTGDLMARWTNRRYRSTPHRVQPMRSSKDRYSIAFFADPDSATPVSVLQSCCDEHNPAQFADITAGQHIAEKIAQSHAF